VTQVLTFHPDSQDEQMAKLLHSGKGFDSQTQMLGGMNMIDLDQVKVTPRDQQVLNLLVQGCSNKEIAGQLNISPRTVKQHLRTLFLRAGIREGRKRVKLAIAMFSREEAQS
jgi:DNA-binding NarL/FixJ family response regulator